MGLAIGTTGLPFYPSQCRPPPRKPVLTPATQVAIKFWPRGPRAITKDVRRELHNLAQFHHPQIIGFKRVILTRTHLGLVMEFASGGDLCKRIRPSKGMQVGSQHQSGCKNEQFTSHISKGILYDNHETLTMSCMLCIALAL